MTVPRTHPSPDPRRRRRALVSCVLLALLTMPAAGCGEDASPAEAVPALSQHLDEVDGAISEGRYDDARLALDALVDATARARVEGTLDAEEVDAILQAVGNLEQQLPSAQEPGDEESDDESGKRSEDDEESEDT